MLDGLGLFFALAAWLWILAKFYVGQPDWYFAVSRTRIALESDIGRERIRIDELEQRVRALERKLAAARKERELT